MWLLYCYWGCSWQVFNYSIETFNDLLSNQISSRNFLSAGISERTLYVVSTLCVVTIPLLDGRKATVLLSSFYP